MLSGIAIASNRPKVDAKPEKVGVPNHSENPDIRKSRIEAKRHQLGYNHELIPKLALAKGLPQFVELSNEYTMERMQNTQPVYENKMACDVRRMFDVVNYVEDYEDYFLHKQVQPPSLVKDRRWLRDDFFAEQRLSGANPMIIQKLERDDPRAAVLVHHEDHLDFVVNNQLSKGNIYVCDYTGTDPMYRGPVMVNGGTSNDGKKKWLPKPLAFFIWEEDSSNKKMGGRLMPVAIQLDASTDPVTYTRKESRVWFPNEKNPLDWVFAKICVQAADIMHHEMSSHLALCHFTIEPIAVAVHRTIADEHPIALLLNTHMRFHIANDSVAAYTLIGENGNVDDLMAGTLREALAVVQEAYDKWDVLGSNFPSDLVKRGLADHKHLPHFPFRDDGRVLWEIIEKWVQAYVKGFYKSDEEVANDVELQDWARECGDQKSGGRVKGMPSEIKKRSVLIDVLTSIIFVCGPHHCAINFAQYEYMAFTPNMPFAIYQDYQMLSEQEEPVTEEQLMKILPDGAHAGRQLAIVKSLTAYKFDKFGNYDRTFNDWFGHDFLTHMSDHKHVAGAYKTFQADLDKADELIKWRNKNKRPINEYPYMQPDNVTNSVSI